MAHLPKTVWISLAYLAIGTASVFAQANDDPFGNDKDALDGPFGSKRPAQQRPIEIDNPTMRQCFRLIQAGSSIAALQGQRAGIEYGIQIATTAGDTDAIAIAQKRIAKLEANIVQRRRVYNSALNLSTFDKKGRAEFDETIRNIQKNEGKRNRDNEDLKLKIQILENQNKTLRERVEGSAAGD